MMKSLLLLIPIFAIQSLPFPVFSQNAPPDILWQRCIGGLKFESHGKIEQIGDGSFVFAGRTQSNDGDVPCQSGPSLLIIKLSLEGEILWTQCLEGHSVNGLYASKDGGFNIIGTTTLNACGNNHGSADAWMAKMDTDGNIEWQRCFGGSYGDALWAMRQTSDGGFILVMETKSNDGEVTGYHGDTDAWVVKLNATLDIEWQRCLGGTKIDGARDVLQVSDGGYILGLFTKSDDGEVSGHHGDYDYWVVRLDSIGDILWQRCFGGTDEDYLASILQHPDGGFLASGFSSSKDGDVTGNHNYYDYWLVKLDNSGLIQWEKSYGGSGWDYNNLATVQTTDLGYLIAGSTGSNDGDVTENKGSDDVWLVKIDTSGSILWQKTFGGTKNEGAIDIKNTIDGGYIMSALTNSDDGDISGLHGGNDFWVVKLGEGSSSANESDLAQDIHLYPSPNHGMFTLAIEGLLTGDQVSLDLFSLDGQLLLGEVVYNLSSPFSHSFDCNGLTSGVYILRVGTAQGIVYKKIVIQH